MKELSMDIVCIYEIYMISNIIVLQIINKVLLNKNIYSSYKCCYQTIPYSCQQLYFKKYFIRIVRLYISVVFINIEIIYVNNSHCKHIHFIFFSVHSPDIDCLIHAKNMRITYIQKTPFICLRILIKYVLKQIELINFNNA